MIKFKEEKISVINLYYSTVDIVNDVNLARKEKGFQADVEKLNKIYSNIDFKGFFQSWNSIYQQNRFVSY